MDAFYLTMDDSSPGLPAVPCAAAGLRWVMQRYRDGMVT